MVHYKRMPHEPKLKRLTRATSADGTTGYLASFGGQTTFIGSDAHTGELVLDAEDFATYSQAGPVAFEELPKGIQEALRAWENVLTWRPMD